MTEYQLCGSDDDRVLVLKDRWEDQEEPQALGSRAGLDPSSTWLGTLTFVSTDSLDQLEVAQPADQAQRARRHSTPSELSETERALRNLTYLPYRSWCSICVQAKARQGQHRQQKSSETRSPEALRGRAWSLPESSQWPHQVFDFF